MAEEKNWRRLQSGEIVRKGDECRIRGMDSWHVTRREGKIVNPDFEYRRRVESKAEVAEKYGIAAVDLEAGDPVYRDDDGKYRKPLTITAGRWLTECGVVVTLDMRRCATHKCPGLNEEGMSCLEVFELCTNVGWNWANDGRIRLNSEWSKKLRIVGPAPEMPEAPPGSKHLDPPEFRKPTKDDWGWCDPWNGGSHLPVSGKKFFSRFEEQPESRWILQIDYVDPEMPPGHGTEEYDEQPPLVNIISEWMHDCAEYDERWGLGPSLLNDLCTTIDVVAMPN
jgi:hypothetical protein